MTCSHCWSFFCAAVRVELLSYVRGAWTAAKPVRGSSYFDTLKHLPPLKHGRERHRENNRDRASFQPLLTGWSSTDCLSLKSIKGQCSLLPFKPSGEHTLMDPASFYTHSFLSAIPSFPLRGHKRGISQKEMPELWRRRLCSLSYHPLHPLLLVAQCWALSHLCNGVLDADNRMSEGITQTTLLLLRSVFLASTLLLKSHWGWQTIRDSCCLK